MSANDPRVVRHAVWAIACAGVGLRWALALLVPPGGGDPSFSYAYRAVLLLDGQWNALWLMWHPPGQPLLLAAVSWLSVGSLSPWWSGVAVTLAATAALIVLVDGLLRSREVEPWARIAVAALLASNEGLVHWARLPLTEPAFLALLVGAVCALDREVVRPRDLVLAGACVGVASTLRFEGALATAGLGLWVVWRVRTATAVAAFCGAWLLTAGWLYGHVDYVLQCIEAQRSAYTVAGAPGLSRFLESGVVAVTSWLPRVLPLPYWGLAAVGWIAWLRRAPGSSERRAAVLLAAVTVPVLLAVMQAVMHKRTGAFLVPAVLVGIGAGLHVFLRGVRQPLSRFVVVAIMMLGVSVDAGRLVKAMRWPASAGDIVGAQASLLQQLQAPVAPVFAFGEEPAVYGLNNWPIFFDYWHRSQSVAPLYVPGDPGAFIEALRLAGVRYLLVGVRPDGTVYHAESWVGALPRIDDVRALGERAGELGVRPLAEAVVPSGRVRLFEVSAPSARR